LNPGPLSRRSNNYIILFLYKSPNLPLNSIMIIEKFVTATSWESRNPRTFAQPTSHHTFQRIIFTFDNSNFGNENLVGSFLNRVTQKLGNEDWHLLTTFSKLQVKISTLSASKWDLKVHVDSWLSASVFLSVLGSPDHYNHLLNLTLA
jgi:hypothetical protein